ncbi:MAG: HEPN domain-containing protein [Candidatus Methanoperedens sp.]|nr:HEPN domain-containing protein [Candidatus Methanoperedens sp.]
MRRHEDWLKQAHSDLDAAEDSAGSSHFEWACFQAQQAAEKALKALIISRGVKDGWKFDAIAANVAGI